MSYNGWTNYETWRINLEMFDGAFEGERLTAESAQEFVEDYLQSECPEGLVLDYALAFVSRVNWYEIAKHHNENLEDEELEGDEDE